MDNDIQFPQGVNPASIRGHARKVDLMRPGNGTPWEDRGSLGAVVAYLKTVVASITSPGLLLDHIRRPETKADGTSFAMISATMWIIGLIALRAWQYHDILKRTGWSIVPTTYAISVAAQCVLVAGGIWLFLNIGVSLYLKLSAAEMGNATPVLVYNLFCYCLGPSLLAVIPIYGQGLALLLIVIDLIIAGKKRLFLKAASATVNVIILLFCGLIIGVIVYYGIGWIWSGYLDMSGVSQPAPVKPPTVMSP